MKAFLRRSRGWVFAVLFWGLFVLAYLLIGARLLEQAAPRPIGQIHSDTSAGPLHGSLTMGQTFWSCYPGLHRIDVNMATYTRVNTHDVIFYLRKSPTATTDLVTIVVNAREIEDNAWHRFEFAPLADSADRAFYFFLASPASTPDNAVTVYGRTSDSYKEGRAYLNDQPAGGDLAFLAYYQATPLDMIGVMLARMAQSKPGWLGQPWFYVVLFAVNLILTTALLVGVWQWSGATLPRDPAIVQEEYERGTGDPA